jgi:hypothetical protein
LFYSFQESWACLKIKEESKVIGPAQPGRKPKNGKKDVNLQALVREFYAIERKDYSRLIAKIIFKEY